MVSHQTYLFPYAARVVVLSRVHKDSESVLDMMRELKIVEQPIVQVVVLSLYVYVCVCLKR